jgi:alkanesulfonate monooxygenase SsuD/methylene tetrahydromethanopterin reductase-like flavin-dependent oxidoreductase (luciferase family)
MTVHLEMGLHTFGDVTADANGVLLPHAVVIRNLFEQAALADELGVDFIGVGEHHRADFAVSAPEIVLAAIASRTKRIRLGSATTVLSSDDPSPPGGNIQCTASRAGGVSTMASAISQV